MRAKVVAHAALALCATILVGACAEIAEEVDLPHEAARVTPVAGSDLSRLVLSATAVRRLGIETTPIGEAARVSGAVAQRVIPYAAVVYDPTGATWAYTRTATRTYIRAAVTVDRIEHGTAFLRDGPPVGTDVVVIGSAELFGIERGL